MSAKRMKRASLAEIRAMKNRSEVASSADAVLEPGFSADFWEKAELRKPDAPRSVHLKLAPEVFDFFYAECDGKGHLTRMQNVLKAYVQARRVSQAK